VQKRLSHATLLLTLTCPRLSLCSVLISNPLWFQVTQGQFPC
jgi:hypothetical protein